MLPDHTQLHEQGLHGKYVVAHAGSPHTPLTTDVFVLRPERDPAARAALLAYAQACTNLQLRADLYGWLAHIAQAEAAGTSPSFALPAGVAAAIHGQAVDEAAAPAAEWLLPAAPPGRAMLLECRSARCTQQVFFACKQKKDGTPGKPTPIDWPPTRAGGHLAVLLAADDSTVMHAGKPVLYEPTDEQAAMLRNVGVVLYTGHFGTCVDADAFRGGSRG